VSYYFSRSKTLARSITVVDGLTGTGKTMYGPIISAFDGMENGRFDYMFEAIQIGWRANKITEDFAISALKFLVDYKLYDGMISREVNFRPTDLSTVLTETSREKYISRLFQNDGDEAIARIESEDPSILFLTHQLLCNMEIALVAFGENLKIIEAVRHPYYLIHHWESNFDFGEKDFNLGISDGERDYPWFARDWIGEYKQYGRLDGAVASLTKLLSATLNVAEDHGHPLHAATVFLPFEHFVLDPMKYIGKIELHVGRKVSENIEKVLSEQNVPREHINLGPMKQIYVKYGAGKLSAGSSQETDLYNIQRYARENLRTDVFDNLEIVARRYEKLFEFWF